MQIALTDNEPARLEREFGAIERDYVTDHLDPVLATGYVVRLRGNVCAVHHPASARPEALSEFHKITEFRKAA